MQRNVTVWMAEIGMRQATTGQQPTPDLDGPSLAACGALSELEADARKPLVAEEP
jgi:hypothetical protein